jgi:hypothetical protein
LQENTSRSEPPVSSGTERPPAANATPRPESPPQPRPAPPPADQSAPSPPPKFLENLRGTDAAPPEAATQPLPAAQPAHQAQMTLPAEPAGPAQPVLPAPPVLPAQPHYAADQLETAFMPLTLSVGAGFKFGCGLLLAVAFASTVLFLVLSVAFFVASLMGLPLPIGAS